MNSLVKDLARGLSINLEHEIGEVLPEGPKWLLKTRDSRLVGPFDWVVSTCPANQTQALFPTSFAEIGQVKLQACFALMLGFDTIPKTGWQAAVFRDSCLNWGSWNNSKPGRSERPALVVLSDNDWADQQLESGLNNVQASMEVELQALTGLDPQTAAVSQLHRWRFAKASQPAGQPYLLDTERRLATCGDWCLGSRVESAFLSAAGLASRLRELIVR
jgi:predicted NAD/FAD-dependent oxidoreductase